MPLFQPVRMQRRPPRIGKAAVVSPYRGILRVQAWPRKRGIPKDPKAKARLQLFAIIQRMSKLLLETETRAMREAIRAHNRKHAGQRGSAAIRQRDWHHQRLMGRGFAFDTDEGITLYPRGVSRTASHLLDHLEDRPRYFACRKPEGWRGCKPTAPNQVLMVNDAGNGVEWITP